jgi:hypothetical protein
MLLSAMSILVFAQPSSEFPEGMIYPVEPRISSFTSFLYNSPRENHAVFCAFNSAHNSASLWPNVFLRILFQVIINIVPRRVQLAVLISCFSYFAHTCLDLEIIPLKFLRNT